MKEKLTGLVPYLIVWGIDFYLLPILMVDTGIAILLMLCVMPLVAFIAGLVYGMRRGFSVLPAVTAAVLFFPTIFIFYNTTAWPYTLNYGIAVLLGTGLGRLFYGKR